jgi:hypothetical protein
LWASRTYGQRGWKAQPVGRLIIDGRAALDRHELLVARRVQRGIERSSPQVYGCSGALNSLAVGACSMIAPRVHHGDLVRHLGDDARGRA